MVGLCGAFGAGGADFDSAAVDVHLRFTGRERRHDYREEGASVHVAFHPFFDDEQPVELRDGRLLWVWGDLRGYEVDGRYRSRRERPHEEGTAEFCASRYAASGMSFVEELNGEFVGIVYDPDAGEVHAFTDRLGSRPLFVAWGSDGQLLCSTQIQLLGSHPGFDPAFDEAGVQRYLGDNHVRGLATPLVGVRKLPPATVTTFDVGSGSRRDRRYWYPTYEPCACSYETFVDRFVETFRAALADCLVDGADHGLMLSGGSDSRLLGTSVPAGTTAFHLTEWEGRETRVTRRVAERLGVPLRILRRDEDYLDRLLEAAPRINNFNGWFQEGHVLGFGDELRQGVDVALFGLFSDAFFKAHLLPLREVTLPVVGGRFTLPVVHGVESLEGYLALSEHRATAYFSPSGPGGLAEESAVRYEDGGVIDHGVRYESVRDLTRQAAFYPLTNDPDYFHYQSSIQLFPHRTPFLDRRLLDLHLSMPESFRLRENVVDDAVERLSPELASIPHGSTCLPLTWPHLAHWGAGVLVEARDKYLPTGAPEPYMTNKPWPDHDAYIRHTGFGERTLDPTLEVAERLPFVDARRVRAVYRAEFAGENRWAEIFALLTLTRMPVTEAVLAGSPHPAIECPPRTGR